MLLTSLKIVVSIWGIYEFIRFVRAINVWKDEQDSVYRW